MATADSTELLLVAAEQRELAGLLSHCRNIVRLGWPVNFAGAAELNGRTFLVVTNGWGSARAAEACDVAFNERRPAACISAGFCGALAPSLKAGEIFIARSVENSNCSLSYEARMPYHCRPAACGKLVTLDRVAQSAAQKQILYEQGWQAVDMEAVGVAARAYDFGVPFYCIRAVTDLAEESFRLDFNNLSPKNGLPSRAALLQEVLKRPYPVALELLRLYKRSRLASKTLGDFLASCQF